MDQGLDNLALRKVKLTESKAEGYSPLKCLFNRVHFQVGKAGVGQTGGTLKAERVAWPNQVAAASQTIMGEE